MEPGGNSGGEPPPTPRKRAACEAISCAADCGTWAMTGRFKRSAAVRTAREFCAGVAGDVQQDLAVGSGIAPQWEIGCGRQHLSMDIAITGPRQAMAGAPSMKSASSRIPALRTSAMFAKSLCRLAGRRQVTLAQLAVTKITTGGKTGPFMVVGQFPKTPPASSSWLPRSVVRKPPYRKLCACTGSSANPKRVLTPVINNHRGVRSYEPLSSP